MTRSPAQRRIPAPSIHPPIMSHDRLDVRNPPFVPGADGGWPAGSGADPRDPILTIRAVAYL
jgi:hypothetical protein